MRTFLVVAMVGLLGIAGFAQYRPTITIQYSQYLGGSDIDTAVGVAVDPSGNSYVAGTTMSSDFPTKNPVSVIAASRQNPASFLTKLNRAGEIVYSTYLNGTVVRVAVDGAGSAVVVGYGATGGFIRRVRPDGSGFVYAIQLPNASAAAVTIDSLGNAIVGGNTTSRDFGVVDAWQPVFGGKSDAFVTKIDPSGRTLFATYIGGSRSEVLTAVATDPAGGIYVTGTTQSTDFPVASNAFQRLLASPVSCPVQSRSNCNDGFVVRFTRSGAAIYSTLLGGKSADEPTAIAADRFGNAYVTGSTLSADFPTARALRAECGQQYEAYDCGDAFITKLDASGSRVDFSTYLGGANVDYGTGIALDANDRLYVSGWTTSTDFLTGGAVQSRNAGGPVFVTTDDARTWRMVSDGITMGEIRKMIIFPDRPNLIYAAGPRGVFRTENGGQSWTTSRIAFNRSVTDLAVDPQSPNIAYAATYGAGVYKTVDGGDTWISANNGLIDQFLYSLEATAIAIAPSAPWMLYLITTGYSFRTTDGASTWIRMMLQNGGERGVAVDPNDSRTAYISDRRVGSYGISKTRDGGLTWSQPSVLAARTGFIGRIMVSPVSSSVIFASESSGLFRSGDAGATWTEATGLPQLGFFSFAASPIIAGTLYVGRFDGVYRSSDDGRSFTLLPSTLNMPTDAVAVTVDRLNKIYAGGSAGSDAFVAVLDQDGSRLSVWTLLAGRRDDRANGLAVSMTGAVYLAGLTRSAEFPVVRNMTAGALRDEQDAFVTAFVPDVAVATTTGARQ